MSDAATVAVSGDSETIMVSAVGFLNLSNESEFRDALTHAVASAKHVVVDLSSVTYVDTATLSHLAMAAKRMLARDSRLKVVVANETQPQYVLGIIGFDAVMDITVPPARTERRLRWSSA